MKYSLLLALLLSAFTIQANDSFTIYLSRHAEKLADQKNPQLTECGIQRAQQLASILEKAEIKQVYSTPYSRTLATAQPTATQQSLTIKQYSPAKLTQFAQELLKRKENTLVVGHSNTTPQLAALLSELDVVDITEKQYRHLYQIQVSDSGKTLILLTQPLTCY
jgi:broad specificity phosphatase PhoE